jgi:hypothetical protein
MRRHILDLYQGVHVTRSFLQGALTFDCIPVEQQPSVRMLGVKEIAAPPPYEMTTSAPTEGVAAVRQEFRATTDSPLLADEFGNAMGCEEHSVPIQRTTVEQMSRFPSLRAFLSKHPEDTAIPPAGPNVSYIFNRHEYAFQNVDNLGASSHHALWKPQINTQWGQSMSLSQFWVYGKSTSTVQFPDQTVEAGWQVYPKRTGDTLPHLFIFFTPDGYNSGCYDTTCFGFIQTNTARFPGMAYSYYSTVGGDQWETEVTAKWWQGNWWVGSDGNWMGYYPGSLFGSGELATHSTRVQFGGEVAAGDGTTYFYYPAMGSGLSPIAGNAYPHYVAYQRTIWYHDSAYNRINPTLTTVNECPSSASITTPTAGYPFVDGDLHFFFGGPVGWCQ